MVVYCKKHMENMHFVGRIHGCGVKLGGTFSDQ